MRSHATTSFRPDRLLRGFRPSSMPIYLRHSFYRSPISPLINRARIPPPDEAAPHFLPSPRPPLPALRKSIPPFCEADVQEILISRAIGTVRRALGLGEALQTERATAQAPPKPRGTKEIASMAGIWYLVQTGMRQEVAHKLHNLRI
jgi:hypothetical protein